jgi:hypothetical protein
MNMLLFPLRLPMLAMAPFTKAIQATTAAAQAATISRLRSCLSAHLQSLTLLGLPQTPTAALTPRGGLSLLRSGAMCPAIRLASVHARWHAARAATLPPLHTPSFGYRSPLCSAETGADGNVCGAHPVGHERKQLAEQ